MLLDIDKCGRRASARPRSGWTRRARSAPGGRGGRLGGIPPRDNCGDADGHRENHRPRRRRGHGLADSASANQHQLARCRLQPQRRDRQRRALRARPRFRPGAIACSSTKPGSSRSSTGRRVRSKRASRSTSRPGRCSRRSISACRAAARLRAASPTSSAIRSPTCRSGAALSVRQRRAPARRTPDDGHRQTILARTGFSDSCRAITSSARRCGRTCRQGRGTSRPSRPDIRAPTIQGVTDVGQAQTVTAGARPGSELHRISAGARAAIAHLGNGDGFRWPAARRRGGDDPRARQQRVGRAQDEHHRECQQPGTQ